MEVSKEQDTALATPKENVVTDRSPEGVNPHTEISANKPVSSPTSETESFDGGELIVRYLEQIGVEYIFGVPGGTIEPIYNALARSEKRGGIRAVLACHETGAAYMADGYMRETGKLGVCIATSGPGATNLITGVACAYDNNIPLLVITGQPALPSFGKGALQESSCTGVDVVGMFRYCTRYNSLISHPDQLETKLVSAILKANQSPQGPVHLSIPVDILREKLNISKLSYDLVDKLNHRPVLIDSDAVKQLQDEIRTSSQKVFFIGNGAGQAIDLIIKLADITNSPFITTPDAKGLINPAHRLYRGVFGIGGHESAELCLKNEAESILAFGSGFGEFSSAGWSQLVLNNKLTHIDELEENLMRSPMAKKHIRGNLRIICAGVLKALFDEKIELDTTDIGNKTINQTNHSITFFKPEKYHSTDVPLKPQRLMKELSDRFPPNTRFLADSGNSMIWTSHFLQPRNRRQPVFYTENVKHNLSEQRSHQSSWLRMTLDFASMGWAIGASIGVSRGNPNCPTVCITGDGSYLMCGQELTIAAQEKLPLVFVILNDSVYGMVMHGQRLAGAEKTAHTLRKVNFKAQSDAMDVKSYIIHSPKDFDQINFYNLLKDPQPILLDVRIDKEEAPPMNLRLKTLGTIQ